MTEPPSSLTPSEAKAAQDKLIQSPAFSNKHDPGFQAAADQWHMLEDADTLIEHVQWPGWLLSLLQPGGVLFNNPGLSSGSR
jgi:hypothetical protein